MHRESRRAFWNRDDGVSAVEFGILLPVLMMVLMGIIDYGYLFFLDLTLTNAVREGARVGVTQPTQQLAIDRATQATTRYLQTANIQATPDVAFDAATGTFIEVTAKIDPFEPLVGYLPEAAFPSTLQATSSMRWEWVATP